MVFEAAFTDNLSTAHQAAAVMSEFPGAVPGREFRQVRPNSAFGLHGAPGRFSLATEMASVGAAVGVLAAAAQRHARAIGRLAALVGADVTVSLSTVSSRPADSPTIDATRRQSVAGLQGHRQPRDHR